jgi:ABC-2 type transport system permease protein/lipopolysaccharide transport system permease protein
VASGPAAPDRVWVENAAPSGRWPRLQLFQLWTHRELIYFFALRDVKVRYKQAFLGAAWAVLQPLVGALAFTLLFHGLADVDVGTDSYFAFALVGFVAWTYFSVALNSGTNSLLWNAELLKKVSLPRLALPVAAILPALIDLAVGAVLAIIITTIWGGGVSPVGLLVGLPAGAVLLVIATAGPVLILSALIVRYRDVSVVVGFGLQLFLFVSPVGYPPELVPDPWYTIQYLNPVAGALALLRWGLTGTPAPDAGLIALSAATAVGGLVTGLYYFRANERQFVDII